MMKRPHDKGIIQWGDYMMKRLYKKLYNIGTTW